MGSSLVAISLAHPGFHTTWKSDIRDSTSMCVNTFDTSTQNDCKSGVYGREASCAPRACDINRYDHDIEASGVISDVVMLGKHC